jgi:hypothetical protein
VPKPPSTDHLRNHGSPARLEEKIVSAQSIKIRAQNMFPRTVNISSGCHIFDRKHDKMFMGWSIKYFRNDNVSAQSIQIFGESNIFCGIKKNVYGDMKCLRAREMYF